MRHISLKQTTEPPADRQCVSPSGKIFEKDEGLRLLLLLYFLGPIVLCLSFGAPKAFAPDPYSLLWFITGMGWGVTKVEPKPTLFFRYLIYATLVFLLVCVTLTLRHLYVARHVVSPAFYWLLPVTGLSVILITVLLWWLGAQFVRRIRAADLQWKSLRELSAPQRNEFFLGTVVNARLKIALIILAAFAASAVPLAIIIFVHDPFRLLAIVLYAIIGIVYYQFIRARERSFRHYDSLEHKPV